MHHLQASPAIATGPLEHLLNGQGGLLNGFAVQVQSIVGIETLDIQVPFDLAKPVSSPLEQRIRIQHGGLVGAEPTEIQVLAFFRQSPCAGQGIAINGCFADICFDLVQLLDRSLVLLVQ